MSYSRYWLKKLKFTMPPLNRAHLKYFAASITLKTACAIVDFLTNEMIKHNEIDWESLTSSAKLMSWQILKILLDSSLLTISLISINKYSQSRVHDENAIKKFRNCALTYTGTLTFIGASIRLSMNTPANKSNIGYIFANAAIDIPMGVIGGAWTFILARLRYYPEPEEAPMIDFVETIPEEPPQSMELTQQVRP